MRVHLSKIFSLACGAIDGLSYPFAMVMSAPVIMHISGVADYSKVAAVILMSSIGLLFNIVGAQGVIYSLSRSDLSTIRRSEIFSGTMIVTLLGMLLFAGCLLVIGRYTGIRTIFSPTDIKSAAGMSWLLCLLISLDSLFGGVLKAHRLISLSAGVELSKFVGLMIALTVVANEASWKSDCLCFILAVTYSLMAKAILAIRFAGLKISSWSGAIGQIRNVTKINSWQWVLLMSGFFFQQADRLVIASRLDAKDFAVYNFCWQVSFVVQSGTAASLMYMLPIATARASAGSAESLREGYFHDVKLGALIATLLVTAFMVTAALAFNNRYFPEALKDGFPLFLIMSTCMYVSSLSVVPYYYLVAFGWLPAIALVNLIGASLSFCTALATVGALGVTGLAISKAWSAVTLSCYWFCRVKLKQRSLGHA